MCILDITKFRNHPRACLRNWMTMVIDSAWKGPFKILENSIITFSLEFSYRESAYEPTLFFSLDFNMEPGKEAVGIT